MQALRQMFETSSKKLTESQKEESKQETKEHGQSSGSEEQEPEATGSVKTKREKFEASSKNTDESQKEESKKKSREPSQRLERQEPDPGGPVQTLRRKFGASSKKPEESHRGESSRRSQKEESIHESRESGQENKLETQDPKPSGPVQAMRQKYETASKKPVEGRKDKSSRGAREHDKGSGALHQKPRSSGPVQAMRQKYEALSDKPAKSHKEAPSHRSTTRGHSPEAAHERSTPSHTSEPSDEKPPNDPDIADMPKMLQPSFSPVQSSTPIDDRDWRRPLTDKELTGMDPEGLQLGVEYPKAKSQSQKPKAPATRPEPKSEASDDTSKDDTIGELLSQLAIKPTPALRTAQDEFHERWYRTNMEKVNEYDLINVEILHMLSQYMPGTNFNYEVVLPAEVLVSMLKDFIENLHKKFRKANLELSDVQESDISVKIHDHKRKALDAVSILEKQLEYSQNKITELKEQIRDLHMELNAAEEKIDYLQQANQAQGAATGYDEEVREMLETRITESMSEKYERELSRITDESNEQRQENNELYEQLVELVRERVEGEEQFMRDLSDAEQKTELNAMLKEALFSVLGYKEPNPQDAKMVVKLWYENVLSVIGEHKEHIDILLRKYESTRKYKEELASHCEGLQDEVESLHFHIQMNKQTITSYQEQNESSRSEIENITQQENALKDKKHTEPTSRGPTSKYEYSSPEQMESSTSGGNQYEYSSPEQMESFTSGGPTSKRSFYPIENPIRKYRWDRYDQDEKYDLGLPTPEPFELPPSSYWSREKEKFFPVRKGEFRGVTPRLNKSYRDDERDSFDKPYIQKPYFASQGAYDSDYSASSFEIPSPRNLQKEEIKNVTPRLNKSYGADDRDSFDRSYIPYFASQGHYDDDESFYFNKRVSISSPGREDPLELNVGVKPMNISESASGEHIICNIDVNVKEDQYENSSPERMESSTSGGNQYEYSSPEQMESFTSEGSTSKRSFSPIENPIRKYRWDRWDRDEKIDLDLPTPKPFELPPSPHSLREMEDFYPVRKGEFRNVTPRLNKSYRDDERDSFDKPYIQKPYFASQGAYDSDYSASSFEIPSPRNRQKEEFKSVTPRLNKSNRTDERDSLDRSYIQKPFFASQGCYADDESHSVIKRFSITSPGRDEPQQLNVEVSPRDICKSRSGEHVFCQIDVNFTETEQPIYEQESKQRRSRRRDKEKNVFSKATPPLTPSRARDPRKGTPTSVFTKHHHGVRNIFNVEPDILYRPPARGNTSIEWETKPSVQKGSGYAREDPQADWSYISATPMNDSEEEDETSSEWNERS